MLDELRLDKFAFEFDELDKLDFELVELMLELEELNFELTLELDRLDFELMELALELDELNFELEELALELDELDFALEELELDIVLNELLDNPVEVAELFREDTLLAALLLVTDGVPGAASPAGSMLNEAELANATLERLWLELLACAAMLVRPLDAEALLRLCNDDAEATLSPPICGALFVVKDETEIVPKFEGAVSPPAPPPQALSIMHNEVVADI